MTSAMLLVIPTNISPKFYCQDYKESIEQLFFSRPPPPKKKKKGDDLSNAISYSYKYFPKILFKRLRFMYVNIFKEMLPNFLQIKI